MNVEASPWTPQQRRWLHALGHVVLRLGPGEEEGQSLASDDRQPVQAPAPLPPTRMVASNEEVVAPRRAPTAPASDGASVATDARVAAPRRTARPAARLPDRLQLAMLRASGLDPASADAQVAMAQWPMDQLRGDAAAKRAFWPQLRALRKRT